MKRYKSNNYLIKILLININKKNLIKIIVDNNSNNNNYILNSIKNIKFRITHIISYMNNSY